MKKLLLGLFALTAISAFADDQCTTECDYNGRPSIGAHLSAGAGQFFRGNSRA